MHYGQLPYTGGLRVAVLGLVITQLTAMEMAVSAVVGGALLVRISFRHGKKADQ